MQGTFSVSPRKLEKLKASASGLLKLAHYNAHRVPTKVLASFIGTTQSLRLFVPETAFRLRAMCDVLSEEENEDRPDRGNMRGFSGHAGVNR